jgi:hypothetical protein
MEPLLSLYAEVANKKKDHHKNCKFISKIKFVHAVLKTIKD